MTSTGPREHERDWDAEFAEIAGRLGGLSSDDAGPTARTSANRVHFEGPEPVTKERADADAWPSRDAPAPHDDDARQALVGPRGSGDLGEHLPREAAANGPAGHVTTERDQGADTAHLDDEPTFVPTAPRPLETDDPATVIMIGALVGGPLWLLYLTVFDREAGGFWWLLAALTVVVGFGLAVARQPKTRDEDDDDDGARV